jgi:hypothetical protein
MEEGENGRKERKTLISRKERRKIYIMENS